MIKLIQLKRILDKMTPEELQQALVYNSTDLSISGAVKKVRKAKANLYNTFEDDPVRLYTAKELKDRGHNKEDIDAMGLEIMKGELVIEF